MADTKITQMTAATSLAGIDVIPVVQSGVNKSATIDVVSKSLTNVVSNRVVQSSSQTVTGAASIDVLTATTILNITTSGPYSGLLGSIDVVSGQQKLIVSEMMLSNYTISVPGGMGFSEIVFTLPGQTALLTFIHGQWYIISHRGCTVA